MTATARRPVLLGTAAAVLLLLVAAPAPGAALTSLRDAGSARDPFEPLVAAVSLVAWALALWIALTALLTVAGRLPGVAGRVFAAVARHVAPAAVRRAVEVALGLTVAVGVLGASPAAAATAADAPAPPAAAASLDWSATSLDRPAATTADRPAAVPAAGELDWPGTAPREPAPEQVVVQPGDTLWGLAERSLEAAGDGDPSDAAIAQQWPAWWSANREAVGDDPDLLQPGTRLSPPDGTGPDGPAPS